MYIHNKLTSSKFDGNLKTDNDIFVLYQYMAQLNELRNDLD
jgi:hypothetical protein